MNLRLFLILIFADALFIAATAHAQQPGPNPQQCNAAINAVVAQRNQAMDSAANFTAQLALVTNDNDSLKKQQMELEKQKADLTNENALLKDEVAHLKAAADAKP